MCTCLHCFISVVFTTKIALFFKIQFLLFMFCIYIRMVRMYAKLHKSMEILEYFTTRSWEWTHGHLDLLKSQMTAEDQKVGTIYAVQNLVQSPAFIINRFSYGCLLAVLWAPCSTGKTKYNAFVVCVLTETVVGLSCLVWCFCSFDDEPVDWSLKISRDFTFINFLSLDFGLLGPKNLR